MSTTPIRFARTAAILIALLPFALFVFRPASAAEVNGGHHNGFNQVRGTLSAANPSDGHWFFVSGQKVRLTAVANSSNGGLIGSMAVYSQKQGWLQTGSPASTQQYFQRDLLGGWHYFRLSANGSATTSYTLTLSSADLAPEAGNTTAAARNLGVVSEVNQAGRVDLNDRTDVYSFATTIPAPGYGQKFITVHAFRAFGNGATIELLASNGAILASGVTAQDSQSPVFATLVPAGSYYLRVTLAGQAGTGYQLYASIEDARPDFGGNPGAMAPIPSRPLGEFVHDRMDPVDMYTFTIAQATTVDMTVTENTGDANLTLLNAQGTVVARSQVANSRNERITQLLAAGEYRLIIGSARAGETAYVFTFAIVQPPAPSTPLDAPGNRFQPAILLPNNQFAFNRSETIGGLIGTAFDTQDWYMLTVPQSVPVRQNDLRAFNVTVSGLPIGATVNIFHGSSTSAADSRTITTAGTVTYPVLLAGGSSNLVQVSVPFGTPLTPYSISLACAGGAPCTR